jgi:hypothetical protein
VEPSFAEERPLGVTTGAALVIEMLVDAVAERPLESVTLSETA